MRISSIFCCSRTLARSSLSRKESTLPSSPRKVPSCRAVAISSAVHADLQLPQSEKRKTPNKKSWPQMKTKRRTRTRTARGFPRSERRGRANPPYVHFQLGLGSSRVRGRIWLTNGAITSARGATGRRRLLPRRRGRRAARWRRQPSEGSLTRLADFGVAPTNGRRHVPAPSFLAGTLLTSSKHHTVRLEHDRKKTIS